MMELYINVNIVKIKQLQKVALNKMYSLSIMKLNIVMSIVTIKQLQKAAFVDISSLSMMYLNIVVIIVTILSNYKKQPLLTCAVYPQ